MNARNSQDATAVRERKTYLCDDGPEISGTCAEQKY